MQRSRSGAYGASTRGELAPPWTPKSVNWASRRPLVENARNRAEPWRTPEAPMALALKWNEARLRKEAALIPPRAALGASMVYHGLGKLREGAPEQVGGWFESIGLRPGEPLAVATGIAEVFAGVGAILGLWTRPAALAVLGTQSLPLGEGAAKNGFDLPKGGVGANIPPRCESRARP